MTLAEAVAAVEHAGAVLLLGPSGRPRIRGRVPHEVVEVLRQDRDRIAALLRLRELHRRMGLSEADVLLVERAFLAGRISEVQIVIPGPATVA